MVGQVGADAFGDELLTTLRAAGVTTEGVRRVPGKATGVALISVASDGQNSIVVAPGANMAWDDAATANVDQAVAKCRLLVLNLEVPPPVIARAIRVAKRSGAQVILNPAPHRRGDEGCFAEVDIFVPNQVEAALLAGAEPDSVTDWGKIGRHLRGLGPRTVVVTLAGGYAWHVEDTVDIHVATVEEAKAVLDSTTGQESAGEC
jgi:ribokinase